jgi:peptide/nickel transport system permease protein
MKEYIARRILLAVPTVIGVSLLVFGIMEILPGNVAVAILGEEAVEEDILALEEELGLNDPWYDRYGRWVKEMVTFGDLGRSLFFTKRPVKDLIIDKFPVTLNLTIYGMIVAVLVGIPLGIISALRRDTWVDYIARIFSIIGLSVPVFWLGVMILLLFAFTWGWQPSIQYINPFDDFWGNFQQMTWPAVTLGYFQAAFIARMTRSSLLEVLFEDYIRTARAKGLLERVVVVRHGMRNAIIPILTIVGLQIVALLSGLVVIERVFNLSGWGALLYEGVSKRDFPVIQTMIFFFALIVIAVNLLVDLLYAWLDPRIRYST